MINVTTRPHFWAPALIALTLCTSLAGAARAAQEGAPAVPQHLSAADRTRQRMAFQSYADAWTAHAEAARLQALNDSLAEGMTYQDASTHAEGAAGVNAMIVRFQHQSPGVTLHLDDLLLWGDHGLAKWSMIAPKGGVMLHGYDVVSYDSTGRIKIIVGFFDVPGQRVGLPR